MYHLLLASVAWAYGTLFGQIVAGILIGVAVFNTYVLCRYPSYRKIREKAAEEEDKRIQDKITSQVQKQAISSVTGGGSKI